MLQFVTPFAVAAIVVACQAPPGKDRIRAAHEPTPAVLGAMDRLKTLQGSWVGSIREMQMPATTRFVVTSGGSALCEIMGEGTEHEMTNVYHLDGDRVVVTHYCAAGNQPRMVSTKITDASIVFELDSVSNYFPTQGGCMGRLEVEFVDSTTVVQRWTSLGGKEEGTVTFDLRR